MKLRLVRPEPSGGEAPQSDAALVRAARAGNRVAQEALFLKHMRMANGLACRLMGRDDDVDDVVQQSFVEALDCLGKLARPQAFESWLASIVVRVVHRILRRRRLLVRLGLRDVTAPDIDSIISRDAPPDVVAELRAVGSLFDHAPPQIRIALVLRRVEGMSIDEVAAHVGASPATVKRRLAAAGRLLDEARHDREGTP